MGDVIINRVSGGLGRVPASVDGVSGLVTTAVAIVGGIQYSQNYELRSIADLEAYGVTKAYDTTNSLLLWNHVSEFFKVSPAGTLWLRLLDQTAEIEDMVPQAENLINGSNGTINQLAIGFNGAVTAASNAFEDLIPLVQTLAEKMFTEHKPCLFIVEGLAFDLASAVDLRTLNAPDVHVFVGQGRLQSAIRSVGTNIGTCLGAYSAAAVNEHVGWVDKFNLKGGELDVAFLSGIAFSGFSQTQKEQATEKGYGFFITHIGRDGIYINETSTCIVETDDFAYAENVRLVNKATRLVRQALLGDLNSPVQINPTNGQLAAITVSTLKSKVNKQLTDQMLTAGEISGFTFNIDPAQNLLATSELNCELEIVPTGTARKFIVNIKYLNPFA